MKTISQSTRRLALSIVVWGLCSLGAGRAATSNVSIGSNFFNPSSSTINVNDTVTWTWIASGHSTTSDSGLWNSGVRNNGATFSRQFMSAGSFPYFCTVHFGMTGTIIVQPPNTPPMVTVTNPPSGMVFSAPASFTLAAAASDPGGSVTNVQFFRGAASLGNDTSSPYSVPVSGLAAGNYTFTAVASDNLGATNTSAAIAVSVVTPVPIILSGAQRSSSTQFQFNYTANVGLRYRVHRSTMIGNWTVIQTNMANTNLMTAVDPAATSPMHLYLVELLPNP